LSVAREVVVVVVCTQKIQARTVRSDFDMVKFASRGNARHEAAELSVRELKSLHDVCTESLLGFGTKAAASAKEGASEKVSAVVEVETTPTGKSKPANYGSAVALDLVCGPGAGKKGEMGVTQESRACFEVTKVGESVESEHGVSNSRRSESVKLNERKKTESVNVRVGNPNKSVPSAYGNDVGSSALGSTDSATQHVDKLNSSGNEGKMGCRVDKFAGFREVDNLLGAREMVPIRRTGGERR
jgi:hypothetical protein